MVDFNSENILSADKNSIMIIWIIEKSYYIGEALEKFDRLKYSGAKAPSYIVKASIKALYNTIRSNIKALDPELNKSIILLFESGDLKDFQKAYILLDDWLYKSGVTKFTTKKKYNSENPLDEARAKGVS